MWTSGEKIPSSFLPKKMLQTRQVNNQEQKQDNN
jgi:hypothetical protein